MQYQGSNTNRDFESDLQDLEELFERTCKKTGRYPQVKILRVCLLLAVLIEKL